MDSTYRTTAGEIFPRVLEEIASHEGRKLADRPIQVIYTHAHFDHAGGHAAVEALGESVEILAHPFTAKLAPLVSARESFLRTRAHFLRDCGIHADLDELTEGIRAHFLELAEKAGMISRARHGAVSMMVGLGSIALSSRGGAQSRSPTVASRFTSSKVTFRGICVCASIGGTS